MNRSLLATKLNVPPLRPNLVSRPRLIAKLDDAVRLHHRLTLVSAKAGSGKTTLVSGWLHRQTRPVAWLSLDANDNDPGRFYRYLAEAIRALGIEPPALEPGRIEVLHFPPAASFVAELIHRVQASGVSFILVFDDYHVIHNEWILEVVGSLVEHLQPEVHLLIITRVDPTLPLAGLRGRGQITEIRDRDLRFSLDETTAFLNDVMQLKLPADALSALEHRTEGWAAGLQMAALSMQGRAHDEGLTAFVQAFGGTHRFILDYLLDEVLNQQPPILRDFLMETSILERLCGSLCDSVRFGDSDSLGGPVREVERHPDGETSVPMSAKDQPAETMSSGSQAILAHLERSNLFVTSLDDQRHWYRYHHLFADLLQSAMREHQPVKTIRERHRRAYRWYRSEGFLEEAMSHAIAAQDFDSAASMIEENIVAMLSQSEVPVLLGWIDKLPEEIVRGRPWIDVYRANTLALTGQVEPVEALLEDVEHRIESDAPDVNKLMGHITSIRAYIANLKGDVDGVAEMAERTDAYLPGAHVTARGLAAYAFADARLAFDDISGACSALRRMLEVGEMTGQSLLTVTALCDLAALAKIEGQLHQAKILYDRAYQWMASRGTLTSRVRCEYEFGLADLLREWNRLEEAREHTTVGMDYRHRLGGYLVVGDIVLMRILQAMGDAKGALDVLDNAERFMQTYYFQLSTKVEFRAARILQWLAVGDVETANYWAEACAGESEPEQIALARVRLAQGRADEALDLLDHRQHLAEAEGRTQRMIEILGLRAVALEAQGHPVDAEVALSRALALAGPERYRRLFLDMGKPLRDLLERSVAQAGEGGGPRSGPAFPKAYAVDLLGAFRREVGRLSASPDAGAHSSSAGEPPIDALTPRELDVLLLLAEGLTNKAIAGKLIVASSTVKQHLKNIYSKLDAHSRTEAVARGRELGYF